MQVSLASSRSSARASTPRFGLAKEVASLTPKLSLSNSVWMGAALVGVGVPLKLYNFKRAYANEGFAPEQQKLLYTQELVRQGLSTGMWATSLLASWAVSRRMFPKSDGFFHFITANAASSLVDIFARPYATAALTRAMMPAKSLTQEFRAGVVSQKQTAASNFSAYPQHASGFDIPLHFANNPFAPRFRG